jgi:hypothetical protein
LNASDVLFFQGLDVSAVNSGFASGRASSSSTLKGSAINIPFSLCSRFSPCSRYVQMFFLEAVILWMPKDWKPLWISFSSRSDNLISTILLRPQFQHQA